MFDVGDIVTVTLRWRMENRSYKWNEKTNLPLFVVTKSWDDGTDVRHYDEFTSSLFGRYNEFYPKSLRIVTATELAKWRVGCIL